MGDDDDDLNLFFILASVGQADIENWHYNNFFQPLLLTVFETLSEEVMYSQVLPILI